MSDELRVLNWQDISLTALKRIRNKWNDTLQRNRGNNQTKIWEEYAGISCMLCEEVTVHCLRQHCKKDCTKCPALSEDWCRSEGRHSRLHLSHNAHDEKACLADIAKFVELMNTMIAKREATGEKETVVEYL